MSTHREYQDDWRGTVRADRQNVLISIVDIVGRKWYPTILYYLHTRGSMQFSELKNEIDDISSKMLSDSLGTLEEEYNLVDRTIVNEKPLRVEYSLTDRGESVGPIIKELRQWGVKYLHEATDTTSSDADAEATHP